MKKYLISVIIPTRNRQKYAELSVRTIYKISDEIQIIVQDNSDDRLLENTLGDIIDQERVVYEYIEERVSAIENYNTAALKVKGEFFIALGDDDALLNNIVDCARWMKENKIDAVKPSRHLHYIWPNPNNKGKENGYLVVGRISKKYRKIDAKKGLIELLKNGGQGYLELPMVGSYHCLVSTETMRRYYEVVNKYYGGCSPDMYSAVCLSLLENVIYVELDYPISLPGVCPESTTYANQCGEHIGKLEDAPHFIGMREPYIWDEHVPYVYSVETIWAETMIKAIKEMGQAKLFEEYFSREMLLQYLIQNNPGLGNQIDIYIEELNSIRGKEIELKESHKKNNFSEKVKGRIKSIIGKQLLVTKCEDIQTAVNLCERYVRKNL